MSICCVGHLINCFFPDFSLVLFFIIDCIIVGNRKSDGKYRPLRNMVFHRDCPVMHSDILFHNMQTDTVPYIGSGRMLFLKKTVEYFIFVFVFDADSGICNLYLYILYSVGCYLAQRNGDFSIFVIVFYCIG